MQTLNYITEFAEKEAEKENWKWVFIVFLIGKIGKKT